MRDTEEMNNAESRRLSPATASPLRPLASRAVIAAQNAQ